MHIGKSYTISEFVFWTRRNILWLFVAGTVPTLMYQVLEWKWLSVPWPVVGLLGTGTAFIIGFKNLQTYNRTWDARQGWGAIMSASRAWAMMCRDFVNDADSSKELIYRHFAWLTALRYQLRSERNWETTNRAYNKEYKKFYRVPEQEATLEAELSKYVAEEELVGILQKNNKAVHLLSVQSGVLKKLNQFGALEDFRFLAMHNALRDFSSQQGRCEGIKNFPYPRQYATINTLFVKLFCLLLPLAMLHEFDNLNEHVSGMLKGFMVWFVIPFSVLISWVYTSLDQVGESTANPFEGSANDVPITQLSRIVEIDIREMLGEIELPPAIQPENSIVM